MKSSLEHLPQRKRRQLAQITAIYQDAVALEMLILFGSHARGNWVDDLRTGYTSDFDLLVVVADPVAALNDPLWSTLEQRACDRTHPALVHTIVHSVLDINKRIRDGHYFFGDIVKEGVMLYDSGRYRLSKPLELPPQRRFELASDSFRLWFFSASQFWRGMNYYAYVNDLRHAMFMLHQSAERAYHAVLLVYTAYKPRSHDLVDLAKRTESLHEVLRDSFPRTTPEDEALLKLLNGAYVDARYSMDYDVTAEELSTLRQHVHVLLLRVLEASRAKLDELSGGQGAGTLLEVPIYDDFQGMPKMPEGLPADLEGWAETFVVSAKARIERELAEIGARADRERADGVTEGEARGEARREARGVTKCRPQGEESAEARGREAGRREAKAQAIAEVLRRRGIPCSEADYHRIVRCRDDEELARLEERVWSVAGELWER